MKLLSALALAGLSAGFPSSAQPILPVAQQVVVTANRLPTALADVVGDVLLITEAQIRAANADSLEDLLRRAGAIQLSRNGGPGQSAGLMLRGMASNGTVVLVDGVRVGSASLGQTDFSTLSLSEVEHIEVLRGPGSSLYGADALGGVVHIFTRRGRGPWQAQAALAAGSGGGREASASAGGSQAAFDLNVSAAHERGDGVSAVKPGDRFGLHNPDADGYWRSSASAKAGWTLQPGQRLGLSVSGSDARAQYDGAEYDAAFNPDPNRDFRNRTRSHRAALDAQARVGQDWTLNALAATQADRLDSGAQQVSRFETRREQWLVQAARAFGTDQRLMAALEHLREAVDTTDFTGTERRTNSLVLGYTARFGRHRLQADVRHDDASVSGSVNTGKLGVAVDLSAHWSVRASGGTAFRAPSFNELYYPFYGSTALRPERSRSVELGAAWARGGLQAQATLWQQRVRDLIGYQADVAQCPPGFSFGCAGNVARARLKGASLSGQGQFGAWHLGGVLDWLDARDADTGERLPRRARHQQAVYLAWAQGPYSLRADVLGVGERREAGQAQAAYRTLDLKAGWSFQPGWQWQARVSNLLDRAYEPVLDAQAPGRQWWLGLRYGGRP